MNKLFCIQIFSLFLLRTITINAAPFQNLDFEATTLPVNGTPSLQPIGIALPGWRAFMGVDAQPNVLFNDLYLGTAFVGLAGTSFQVVQGNFSVLLAPGANPFNLPENVGVTISQTGHIPDYAHSIRFLGLVGYIGPPMPLDNHFGVFLDGQRLEVLSDPLSGNFVADISAFAGSDATLGFTSFNLGPLGPNALILDSISFSAEPVPEPGVFGLSALGVLLLFWRTCKARRD